MNAVKDWSASSDFQFLLAKKQEWRKPTFGHQWRSTIFCYNHCFRVIKNEKPTQRRPCMKDKMNQKTYHFDMCQWEPWWWGQVDPGPIFSWTVILLVSHHILLHSTKHPTKKKKKTNIIAPKKMPCLQGKSISTPHFFRCKLLVSGCLMDPWAAQVAVFCRLLRVVISVECQISSTMEVISDTSGFSGFEASTF